MKKMPGDIIILHKCTKNQDHMLYYSWDMVCDGCNCYFSFWTIFCSFTPLTAPKMKISKKWKKPLEMSSFYTSVPKIMIIWCNIVPEVSQRDGCNCYFFILGYFLPFYPLTAQEIKISQKWKKHLEISSCYTYVPNIMIRWCMVPEKWCTTDRRTDGKSDK